MYSLNCIKIDNCNLKIRIGLAGVLAALGVIFSLRAVADISPEVQSDIIGGRYADALAKLPATKDTASTRFGLLIKLNQAKMAVACAHTYWTNSTIDSRIALDMATQLALWLKSSDAKEVIAQYAKIFPESISQSEALNAIIDSRDGNAATLIRVADDYSNHQIESPLLADAIYQKLIIPCYDNAQYTTALTNYFYLFEADPKARANPDYMIEYAIVERDAGLPLQSIHLLNDIQTTFGNRLTATQKAWLSDVVAEDYLKLGDHSEAVKNYELVQDMSSNNEAAKSFMHAVSNRIAEASKQIAQSRSFEVVSEGKKPGMATVVIIASLFLTSIIFLFYLFRAKVTK